LMSEERKRRLAPAHLGKSKLDRPFGTAQVCGLILLHDPRFLATLVATSPVQVRLLGLEQLLDDEAGDGRSGKSSSTGVAEAEAGG
ncbi:MAG: hypothetical protein ACRDXC_09585, partial [Acidimicrobiales bacterium]